jgi:hypothetical protein
VRVWFPIARSDARYRPASTDLGGEDRVRLEVIMGWQDISVPIRAGMITFEGDPLVRLDRARRATA